MTRVREPTLAVASFARGRPANRNLKRYLAALGSRQSIASAPRVTPASTSPSWLVTVSSHPSRRERRGRSTTMPPATARRVTVSPSRNSSSRAKALGNRTLRLWPYFAIFVWTMYTHKYIHASAVGKLGLPGDRKSRFLTEPFAKRSEAALPADTSVDPQRIGATRLRRTREAWLNSLETNGYLL